MRVESRHVTLINKLLSSVRETLIGELLTNKRFVVGFSIFLALVLLGYIGSLYAYPDPFNVSYYSPDKSNRCTEEIRYLPPNPHNLLGTDNGCRDIFTWLTVGLKNSLWIAALAGAISTIIASILGLIAGYRGGLIDDAINFSSNFLMVIPMFIVLLMVVAYVPEQLRSSLLVAVVIGILSWPGPTRVVRSLTLQNKSSEYVEMAKLTNFTSLEIVLKEILPNIASYVFLIYINSFSSAIFAEVGIGAIGFGPFDAVTLGRAFNAMINGGAIFIGAWWWFVPLGLVVVFLSYSLLQINLGLQHVFNPRLKFTVYAV
ncbi:MAG: ABC transporter permease [Sulfolobales archaeon]